MARRKRAGAGKSEPPCLRDADGLGGRGHGHVRANGLLRSRMHATRRECSETTCPRPGVAPALDNGTKDEQPGQPPRPNRTLPLSVLAACHVGSGGPCCTSLVTELQVDILACPR